MAGKIVAARHLGEGGLDYRQIMGNEQIGQAQSLLNILPC
jgi:hypothetical protein